MNTFGEWRLLESSQDQRFSAGNKEYILRFTPSPSSKIFPNSPYSGNSEIWEISWFPITANQDDIYARSGGSSISDIREIFRTLPELIKNWIQQNNPRGFYWKGSDPKLQSIWNKLTASIQIPGYVRSQTKPHVFLQQKFQPYLDQMDI